MWLVVNGVNLSSPSPWFAFFLCPVEWEMFQMDTGSSLAKSCVMADGCCSFLFFFSCFFHLFSSLSSYFFSSSHLLVSSSFVLFLFSSFLFLSSSLISFVLPFLCASHTKGAGGTLHHSSSWTWFLHILGSGSWTCPFLQSSTRRQTAAKGCGYL